MESIATSVIPLLSGPSSAVIVLLLVLGATYWMFSKQILPMFKLLLNKRDEELDKLMSEHSLDRAAWLVSINKISDGIDELRVSQGVLSNDMDNVLNNVKGMRADIAVVLANGTSRAV